MKSMMKSCSSYAHHRRKRGDLSSHILLRQGCGQFCGLHKCPMISRSASGTVFGLHLLGELYGLH